MDHLGVKLRLAGCHYTAIKAVGTEISSIISAYPSTFTYHYNNKAKISCSHILKLLFILLREFRFTCPGRIPFFQKFVLNCQDGRNIFCNVVDRKLFNV